MKHIEKTLKHCNKCNSKTTHLRNGSQTGLIMLLVHIALIVMTGGIWLVALIVYKILTAKIGGWVCEVCNA